ncbi:MAG: hypothetical protein RJA22_2327 [Verrucomicrobiota bacterium]
MSQPETKPNPASPTAPKPQADSKIVTRITVVLVVLAVSAAALFYGYRWIQYRWGHVVLAEASVKGTLTRVGARLDGRILSIEVELGQKVSKGDVLLRMDDRHLRAALERARAEYVVAERELETERMGIEQTRRRITIDIERTKGSLSKARGELEADRSRLRRMEKDYERIAALKERGAESQSALDRITGDRDYALGLYNAGLGVVEVAESNHDKAVNEMEGIKVRERRLGVLEGQVAMAKARVTAAEVELDSTIVRAEADGRVVERIVEVGGSAKVGEPLLAMWIGRPWVEAWANERDLRKFRVGSPVEVAMAASPQRKLLGRVESFGLVTDRALQLGHVPSTLHSYVRPNAWIPVRVALDEEHPQIQLGLSVIVGIRKEAGADAAVATTALAHLDPARTNTLGQTIISPR